MTSPAPTSSASRPGNRRLAAATAALIAAVGLYAALHRPPVVRIGLCTMGDSAQPQLVAHVAGTDTLFVLDSAAQAYLDSASRAGVIVAPSCSAMDRDTTAVHHAQLASHDSLMRADSLRWVTGDTLAITTNREQWRTRLGAPGKAPP